MNRTQTLMAAILTGLLLITGIESSSGSNRDWTSIDPAGRELVAYLIWCIRDARNLMETQVHSRKDYSQEVQSVAKKLEDIEDKLEEIEKWPSLSLSGHDAFQIPETASLDQVRRVRLLGARALTEFRVRELHMALDGLTDERQDRQVTFHQAVEKADALMGEVSKIRDVLQPRMYRRELTNTAEIVQTSPMGPRIEGGLIGGRSDSSKKDESTVFFTTASADAGPIKGTNESVLQKTGINKEAEISADELTKRTDEVTKQAKALQRLVSDLLEKAESIKRQEKTTDSKLNDMRLLKKSWESKKIPVNIEIDAVENKLTSEMVKYQETLKDVDRVKQFLTTMFNGMFQQAPETRK